MAREAGTKLPVSPEVNLNGFSGEFRQINPQCRTVCVNIRSTSGKSVFNYRLGVLEIAGWSSAIFDTIKNNSKGYQSIIDEIEAIVL